MIGSAKDFFKNATANRHINKIINAVKPDYQLAPVAYFKIQDYFYYNYILDASVMLLSSSDQFLATVPYVPGNSRYEILNIPDGDYKLSVIKSGYESHLESPFSIAKSTPDKGTIYVYRSGFTIHVTVNGESGPATVLSATLDGNSYSCNPYAGGFTMYGVPAGTYTLTVKSQGYPDTQITNFQVTGTDTCSPNPIWIAVE